VALSFMPKPDYDWNSLLTLRLLHYAVVKILGLKLACNLRGRSYLQCLYFGLD
jgi:hypothetical protein